MKFNNLYWKDQTYVSLAVRYGIEKASYGFESLKSAINLLKLFGVFALVDIITLRYIKDWVIWGTFKNEGGWSISVSMQPIDTKLSKKMKLVTKAHFDKQLSQ